MKHLKLYENQEKFLSKEFSIYDLNEKYRREVIIMLVTNNTKNKYVEFYTYPEYEKKEIFVKEVYEKRIYNKTTNKIEWEFYFIDDKGVEYRVSTSRRKIKCYAIRNEDDPWLEDS